MRLDVSATLRSAQHDGKKLSCHPEMGLLVRLTKDLAVRRSERKQIISRLRTEKGDRLRWKRTILIIRVSLLKKSRV